MFDPDQYQLLDFGRGRKLERFGELVLDRPCAAAEGIDAANGKQWSAADGRFQRGADEQGVWTPPALLDRRLHLRRGPLVFELRATPFGHVGLFPEQAPCWDWMESRVRRGSRPLRVLNLFAHTGGSTLAAAAAGAEVVHVDSSRPAIAWARRNARLSGLAEAPIRWIADDAVKFARREAKRGRVYEAVVLDPPSYGHGPGGEPWKLTRDLLPLLNICGELTQRRPQFMFCTCHSPGIGPAELAAYLAEGIFGHCSGGIAAWPLALHCADGRTLPAGTAAAFG